MNPVQAAPPQRRRNAASPRRSWRSRESPSRYKVGGQRPTKRARRSALPRSSWSTVLARIHSAMHSPIEPMDAACMCQARNPVL